jgi:hypothetical protein
MLKCTYSLLTILHKWLPRIRNEEVVGKNELRNGIDHFINHVFINILNSRPYNSFDFVFINRKREQFTKNRTALTLFLSIGEGIMGYRRLLSCPSKTDYSIAYTIQ